MSQRLVWFVGNRNPSITENIVDDAGAPVDLTGATVKFKARAAGASALLVDAVAQIVSAPAGTVRYDWTAGDIAANGILSAERDALVWWEVTNGGKTQDVMEAIISVRDHAPSAHVYVELEEFKETLSLKGQSYADGDIELAIEAASRGLDKALGQHFYLDVDNTAVRKYSFQDDENYLRIDPLVALNKIEIDRDGDGTYEELWVQGVDYVLEPVNAPSDGKPWTAIRVIPRLTTHAGFPCYYPNGIKVTGQFGWPSVPAGVKQLTSIIASRLLQRTRQAPFGIIQLGGDGAAVRAAKFAGDPEYAWLTAGLRRKKLLV